MREFVERALLILCAAAGAAGLGIQFSLLATGPLGFSGGFWRFLAFFTIWTNILVTSVTLVQLLRPSLISESLRGGSALFITIVSIVYTTVLRNLWEPEGWQLLADVLLHYGTAVLFLTYWLVFAPKRHLRWRDALRWMSFPLAYFVFAIMRGGFEGFYPYPFIDVGENGPNIVALNAAGLMVLFLVFGFVFVAFGKFAHPREV